MVLSDHTSLTNLFISHLAHQVLDRVLSDLAHVHNILISYILCISFNSLVVYLSNLYIKHNEGYSFYQFYNHTDFENLYG